MVFGCQAEDLKHLLSHRTRGVLEAHTNAQCACIELGTQKAEDRSPLRCTGRPCCDGPFGRLGRHSFRSPEARPQRYVPGHHSSRFVTGGGTKVNQCLAAADFDKPPQVRYADFELQPAWADRGRPRTANETYGARNSRSLRQQSSRAIPRVDVHSTWRRPRLIGHHHHLPSRRDCGSPETGTSTFPKFETECSGYRH